MDEGFLHLPAVIPLEIVAEIRRAIVGESFGNQHPWFGEKRKDRRLQVDECPGDWLQRVLTLVQPIAERIVGASAHEIVDIQFSLIESGRPRSNGWHIDGTWLAREQQSFAPIPFFRLLIGIYLTDLSQPDRGTFIIHPRGHHDVAHYFHELANGAEPGVEEAFGSLGLISVPPELQLLAQPGDVICAHPLLPHSIAANHGSDRPVLYLRFGEPKYRGISALRDVTGAFLSC